MTVGRPAWETRWPQVNRGVEGLRDGLGAALGDQLVGLVAAPQRPGVRGPRHVPGPVLAGTWAGGRQAGRAAWASWWLGPPWLELVARAMGWRADQRPDDDGLGANYQGESK
jgi:hypothetical protein